MPDIDEEKNESKNNFIGWLTLLLFIAVLVYIIYNHAITG